MARNKSTEPPPVLLVEEEFLLRRTISMTAKELGLGAITESNCRAKAAERLMESSFSAVVLGMQDLREIRDLLADIRAGSTASPADVPVALLINPTNHPLLREIVDLKPNRVLVKPVRVKLLLGLIADFKATGSFAEATA